MTIQLIIDNREYKLVEKLHKTNDIIVEQLDIGDIIFREDNNIILVIERKTVKDLKASICDGRAREQKLRLLGNIPHDRIIYLIEGSLDKKLNEKIEGISVSILISSIINTQLRDGIKVYKTETIDETIEFIQRLYEKLNINGNDYFQYKLNNITPQKYVSTLKKRKKSNITPKLWLIYQLSFIPQVSQKIAEVITEKYCNISNLILNYERTEENLREKLLEDLIYPIKNGKNRRIGNKISKRIYYFLYGISDD